MNDEWEIEHFGDLTHTGNRYTDLDSLSDLQEFKILTDPNDPDTDNDGMPMTGRRSME